MTELELLQMRYEENLKSMADLSAENAMIKQRITEILESEIIEDNPFWTERNELWGRDCKVTLGIKQDCLDSGDRSLMMYAEWKPELNTKYVVPLTDNLDDVPAEYMSWYASEQSEHFYMGLTGGLGIDGYHLDEINTEDGELEGYSMIWCGNPGPVVARQRFEGWWSQPDIMDIVKSEADRHTRYLDWGYQRAVLLNKVPEFMAKRPYYIPEA